MSTLWFAQPYHGIDHAAANVYLRSHIGQRDRVALCGLADDPDYTCTEITSC